MKLTGLFSLVLVVFVVGCSASQEASVVNRNSGQRSGIIGGTLVSSSDPLAKSVVGIYDSNEGYICTGSLLANNLVVTAAHCIGEKAAGVFIVFSPNMERLLNSGKKFLKSPLVRRVVAMKAHEGFAPEVDRHISGNDIGLMKYAGTTPEGYVPATLLNDQSVLKAGAFVTLAGYGVNHAEVISVDLKHPDLQRMIDTHEVFCDTDLAHTAKECIREELDGPAELKQVSVEVLEVNNPGEVILDESKGKAACSGDSGGPAYIEIDSTFYLWGATSRSGLGCNQDIIYTNVLNYLDWIQATSSQWH